jgi:ubiquinone/menaquinone biosynthesis C-methylase UbiE
MQLEQAFKLISHTEILRPYPTTWADLGCGSGLFTNALAAMLKPGGKIIAVDKDMKSFNALSNANGIMVEKIQADFTADGMKLSDLDGILMANSLHFVEDKTNFIKKAVTFFKQAACFVIVEYDTDVPNPWVPYPLSFHSLKELFTKAGFHLIEKIYTLPSRYNRANIYSAIVK